MARHSCANGRRPPVFLLFLSYLYPHALSVHNCKALNISPFLVFHSAPSASHLERHSSCPAHRSRRPPPRRLAPSSLSNAPPPRLAALHFCQHVAFFTLPIHASLPFGLVEIHVMPSLPHHPVCSAEFHSRGASESLPKLCSAFSQLVLYTNLPIQPSHLHAMHPRCPTTSTL